METIKSTIENEPTPKDISSEFINMDPVEFRAFLREDRKEPALSITIDWVDIHTARRLKAFLEGAKDGQERTATIRATEEQYKQELNVFTSGVKWERV